MIRLSGRFLKYNLIDKNGVQFSKSATIKIPSKVFVLFNFDKSHPIGIAKVIKDGVIGTMPIPLQVLLTWE